MFERVLFCLFTVIVLTPLNQACSPRPTIDLGWTVVFDDSLNYSDEDKEVLLDKLDLGLDILIARLAVAEDKDEAYVFDVLAGRGRWTYYAMDALPIDDVYGYCTFGGGMDCAVGMNDPCIARRADLHEALHVYFFSRDLLDGDAAHEHAYWRDVVVEANWDLADILCPQE